MQSVFTSRTEQILRPGRSVQHLAFKFGTNFKTVLRDAGTDSSDDVFGRCAKPLHDFNRVFDHAGDRPAPARMDGGGDVRMRIAQ